MPGSDKHLEEVYITILIVVTYDSGIYYPPIFNDSDSSSVYITILNVVTYDSGIYCPASFNDSDSSNGDSDELMSGPDAVAKMSNVGASGSFSSDYYKYMESKKNRHSFSAG